VGRFGGGLPAYGGMALVMTAISLAAMLASVAGTAGAAQTEASSVRMPPREQIRIVLSNRPFMVLIFSKLMLLLALSAITTSLYYVVTQIMQRGPSALSLYGIVQNAGILVSLRFWVWLGRRHSKQALFAAAVLGGVPLSLSWLLASPAEPLWVFGVRAGLLGFFAGGSLVMGQSMLPDTIDFDHQRSGMRREGVFSAIYSFVEKASFAAGPLIVGSLLGAFGYVASRTGAAPVTQTPEALRAVYIGVAIVPAVAALIAAASLRFYTLTEQSLRRAPLNTA
jgi:GPH family glycoside/pentoside/hexuronide:cation symporter